MSGLNENVHVQHGCSLDPDGVGSVRSPRVRRQVAEGGEELFHLLLQHFVSLFRIVLGSLGVSQLDLHHGVFLLLLVQLFV